MAIKRTYKIIAVDFDGTLCEACYPDIGKANISLIEYLKQQRLYGNKIILWTCRANRQLTEAVEWCDRQGLIFDAINSNLQQSNVYTCDCVWSCSTNHAEKAYGSCRDTFCGSFAASGEGPVRDAGSRGSRYLRNMHVRS